MNNNFRNPTRDPYSFSNNYGSFYPSIPTVSRPTLEGSRIGYYDPNWRSIEETFIPRPLGIMGLPLQPPSRLQIHVLNNNNMPQTSSPPQEDSSLSSSSRLTQDEQKNALKKLRKEIYNPIPKRISSRLCLYYRDQASKIVKDMEKEKEEEGKRCAICLEDFEIKEMVMLTPCNHMFHEDCIVPWVTSHGQCPVCRSFICQPSGERIISGNNNNNNNITNNDLFGGGDLISILRAMGVV